MDLLIFSDPEFNWSTFSAHIKASAMELARLKPHWATICRCLSANPRRMPVSLSRIGSE